jgi:exonuclease VII small subunit
MGATVVSGSTALTAANWAKSKPADYKGQDLDRALKSFEAAAGKSISIPNNLIPKVPKPSIGEIETCITGLESAVTELQKGLAILRQIVAALQAVQGAAGKAAGDLRKLAKGKDSDKDAYESAAGAADFIGAAAGDALGKIQ